MRYVFSLAVSRGFYATFAINMIGSLLIGIACGYFMKSGSPALKGFLVTGVLGGFTTFSAFSYEIMELASSSQGARAAAYALVSAALGPMLAFAGMQLVK